MLSTYDPSEAPHPLEWRALDEDDQVRLVREFHEREDIDVPNDELHALLHATVETQVAMGDQYPVAEVVDRLQTEGLTRHQALHAVGSVLMKYLWEIGQSEGQGGADSAYLEEVQELTAEQWLNEEY